MLYCDTCLFVIDTVLVQNLLVPFCCDLGKNTFSCLVFKKFKKYIYIKLRNQNKKFQPDSNILASPEVGRGNCLPYILVPSICCESGGYYKSKMNLMSV